MAIIALEGIQFNAAHGFYEEETELGTEFEIDVYVDYDIEEAADTDDLYTTLNYETIYLICQSEMKKQSKLLETVVQRIAYRIRDYYENIVGLKVRLRKLNPPLGGRVRSAYVEVNGGSFKKVLDNDDRAIYIELEDEQFFE